MHCSPLDADFCHDKGSTWSDLTRNTRASHFTPQHSLASVPYGIVLVRVRVAQESEAKCLRLKNLKVEIPTTKTAIHPWITEMLMKGCGKLPE